MNLNIRYLTVACMVLLLASCSSSEGKPVSSVNIKALRGPDIGAILPRTFPGKREMIVMRPLCVTGGKSIPITKVTASPATAQVRVLKFRTRLVSDVDTTVHKYGQNVEARCGSKSADQFVVQVMFGASAIHVRGFDVHWGDGQSIFTQYDVVTCAARKCS